MLPGRDELQKPAFLSFAVVDQSTGTCRGADDIFSAEAICTLIAEVLQQVVDEEFQAASCWDLIPSMN